MIPSIVAWRPPLSMPQSKESSRFFFVEAVPYVTLPNLLSVQREKLRTRALLNENVRGGQVRPSGWCSRFVCSTWSTSLLAHAPKVVRSLGSQQKYCVALTGKLSRVKCQVVQ